MKKVVQVSALFVAMFALAIVSEADELESTLQSHFEQTQDFTFTRYQRVDQPDADEYGTVRYLVMDFDLALADRSSLQRSVHTICTTVLKDTRLIRNLSDAGYDMISVSFDQRSQYDCL